MSPAVAPGTLLVAPSSEDADPIFARAVVLILDCEPNGIVSGVVLNRPLAERVLDRSALALVFVSDPQADLFWGGPMGEDLAVLAEFSSVDGLDWFHLPVRQRRPFPLPSVGVISVTEHPDAFEGRIRRARAFDGLCVWGAGQLEGELARNEWRLARAEVDDIFCAEPNQLWSRLMSAEC
jgi:putative transcriptional regulator